MARYVVFTGGAFLPWSARETSGKYLPCYTYIRVRSAAQPLLTALSSTQSDFDIASLSRWRSTGG